MTAAATRALVSGYPQRLWGEKRLVMLQAFIDDSTSNAAGRRNVFLAAYMQTAEGWIAFTEEWDRELSAEPAVSYFKMSEAMSRRGEFRTFSEAARNRKVFKLAQIIAKHRPWGFHASVSLTEYNRIFKPVAPYPLKTPFFPLCYAILFGVSRVHHSLGARVPCEFIFDHQDGLAAKVVPLFDLIVGSRKEPWVKLISGTPSFRDDKHLLPIQAADMLAWHVRRWDEGNYPPELGGLDELLIVEDVHHCVEMDRATLERLADPLSDMPWAGAVNSKEKWAELMADLKKTVEASGLG